MRRALTLAAACLALAFPTAATADAQLRSGNTFENFTDTGLDPTTVLMCWGDDYFGQFDSWTIRRAAGTTAPPPDAPVLATVPGGTEGVCYQATDLVTDMPYTFRITGNSEAGETGPSIITLASRDPGGFALAHGSTEKLPGSLECCGPPQLAFTGRRLHAVYETVVPGERQVGLYYSGRGAAGWSKPERLAAGIDVQFDVPVAASAGTVAVAWNSVLFHHPKYRLRRPGASRFGPPQEVPAGRIEAIALDRRGRVHMLVDGRGPDDPNPGLFYRTNTDGHWRNQRLSGKDEVRRPLLAYDGAADRLVVVEQHRGIRIRVASKRASARKLGAFHELRGTSRRHFFATGLTSRGGRVTVGLESTDDFGKSGRHQGPLYVSAGGRLIKVPGTSADDRNLRVFASSPGRVQLAWQRASATWDPKQQGIWTAETVRNRRTGRWSIRAVRQRTSSAYDVLGSLRVDAAGRPLLGYLR